MDFRLRAHILLISFFLCLSHCNKGCHKFSTSTRHSEQAALTGKDKSSTNDNLYEELNPVFRISENDKAQKEIIIDFEQPIFNNESIGKSATTHVKLDITPHTDFSLTYDSLYALKLQPEKTFLPKTTYTLNVKEIKLDKAIDITMVRIAIEKIARYNPNRYYILSYLGIKETDKLEIDDLINQLKFEHGCQIIINGLLPTIKYYLRLIDSLDEFVKNYNELVQNDNEIKKIHKLKWNELIDKYLK